MEAIDATPTAAAPARAERAEGSTGLGPEESELHRRLIWLAAFRIAAVTVLVGTTAVLTIKGGEPLGGRSTIALSALAVATNLLQIGIVLLARMHRWLRRLAQVQILGDVVFAGALVFLTGGSESLFTFLFLLSVVNGGILLARQGAWFAAICSFGSYVGLLVLQQFRWIQTVDGSVVAPLKWVQLYQATFTHGAAFGLMAVATSYVAVQLERAGARAESAEDSLSRLGVLHDAIVRSISSGIVTTDEKERVTFINRAGEEILGQSLAALQRMPLEIIFPSLRATLAGQGSAHRLEGIWKRPDGQERILGFTVSPLVDGEGRRLGTATVFQDLTPFRALEARAALSERLATVGELSAGLAHELRNPLASISGSIEMLAAGRGPDDDERRLFDIVLRETERLNALVSDFLTFARPAAPVASPVDLRELLFEMEQICARDARFAHVHLETDLAEAVGHVDPSQLRQVIWNLLLNAAQASSAGGRIWLLCGRAEEPGRVYVAVEDEGRGIPQEILPRIFDPFFTTKAQGTGLGLATVHRIVEALGGAVEVQSCEGKGTRFTVMLPAPAQEA